MSTNIKNILLITVHYLGYTKDEIGLCSLSSYIRQFGYNVKLIGDKLENIEHSSIIDFHPDIIGATIYERTKKEVLNLLYKIKTILPQVKLCIGGPSVTFHAKKLLETHPFIDFAIKGEGEIPLLSLLRALENNDKLDFIKGLAFRDEVQVHCDNTLGEYIGNLDLLPFPSRDLLAENKLSYAVVTGSRGCKGACSFCYAKSFWKNWRGRSISNIVDEIEYLKETFGVNRIIFEDNSLEDPYPNCSRLRMLAKELIHRNLNILYDCNMRTEVYRKLDVNTVKLLKKSGLCVIFLGIESGNESDLKKVYKKIATLEDNNNSLFFFKKCNIPTLFGFINFNPYSTFEKLYQNIDFLENHMGACSFRNLYSRTRLYRGTSMFQKILSDGLFRKDANEIGEELSYSFENPVIEKLSTFLEKYFQDALLFKYFKDIKKKDNNEYEGIQLLFRVWYSHILSHLIRYFENNNLKKELLITNGYKRAATTIFEELNSINAKWFRSLLEFTETGWDEREAIKIIERDLSPELVKSSYNKLSKLKDSLNTELKRIDNNTILEMTNYMGYS